MRFHSSIPNEALGMSDGKVPPKFKKASQGQIGSAHGVVRLTWDLISQVSMQ